ncbi:Caskin/Ankyrin repeat-containing protein [Dioscorea alata]|uniref:Caskin/Ankyrin repeat-containing protein n=1 Tax=Dioscorea alata TaxID=55571 RepID=A0ACB7WLW1_DIOAL|nr:Caskin/Ankyrin repeat-containing protein [Dioscorea alata]
MEPPSQITIHVESQDNKESTASSSTKGEPVEEELSKEIRAAIMVIAILVTTVTYQAVLNPPGGFWQDDLQSLNSTGHTAGNPVMATKHPRVYGVFVAVNASAFAISIGVMACLFVPPLHTLGVRFENFLLYLLGKWMKIEYQNFQKGRNISSNPTAVMDELTHLMQYVGFVYFCLLLASALWVFQHLRGPGLVVCIIAYPSINIFALALVFIPRLYQMWKMKKKEEKVRSGRV